MFLCWLEHYSKIQVCPFNTFHPKNYFLQYTALLPHVIVDTFLMASPVLGCKIRLDLNIFVSSCQQVNCKISYFILAYGQKATSWTEMNMLYSDCSMHMQMLGMCKEDHPYLSVRASLKAPLWRQKLNS